MKNYIQPGKTVTLTAPYQRNSGEGMLVGSLFAVAGNDVANGDEVEADVEGVFELPKETGAGWTQGMKVYWDNTNKRVSHTASGNTLIGCAVKIAASGDAKGIVRLNAVA